MSTSRLFFSKFTSKMATVQPLKPQPRLWVQAVQQIGNAATETLNCSRATEKRIGAFSLEIQLLVMALGYVGRVQLSLFSVVVAFFHTSEYLLVAAIHGRSNVSCNSFLISKQYIVAMMFSLLEYFIEICLFPEMKDHRWISNVGLVMVLAGEVIRKSGILTAGRAFTHIIRVYHLDHHELITWGIYRFMRHPGYCGFFLWAIGTQLILCNPISTVGFTVVTWRFFSTRIPYEEFFLRQFFGPEYIEYAERVPSGLPFIK